MTVTRWCGTVVCAGSLLLVVACAAPAAAAELRLYSECRNVGGLVLLGDVADVFAVDEAEQKRLSMIELFPAPAPGQERFVHVGEIQNILSLRGVNLAEVKLTGASRVTIHGPAMESRRVVANDRIAPHQRRHAHESIRAALAAELERQSPGSGPWDLDISLDDEQIRKVAAIHAESLAIEAERAALLAGRPVVVTGTTDDGPVRLLVAPRVQQRPMIVVAGRGLSRGSVIRRGDVRLEPVTGASEQQGYIDRLELVVGQETTRAITAGQAITTDLLRPQVLVHRGEVVTVYARSSGVQVRTTGRAREDGSLGDLVMVESLLDRQAFYARVSGIQEVEVFARATAAPNDSATAAEEARKPVSSNANQAAAPSSGSPEKFVAGGNQAASLRRPAPHDGDGPRRTEGEE